MAIRSSMDSSWAGTLTNGVSTANPNLGHWVASLVNAVPVIRSTAQSSYLFCPNSDSLHGFPEKLKIWKKKAEQEEEGPPLVWFETSATVSRRFQFEPNGQLSCSPCSVNEGYLRYTQFRALQHTASAALSVLSTQSLLFAAGLRPTPAQATAVSWGMSIVASRATRLPIYSSFAKEGNLSDLFARGEAISTLFNVVGIGIGIQLASTVCASMQGKLVVGPLLSIIHIYSVSEEMRATPVNTLNPQRTAMIVADFLKAGSVSSPADLRYREDLLFPRRLIEDAGNVRVGRDLHKVIKPSRLLESKQVFPGEKFILNGDNRCIDMVLEQDAIGKDALRGWLVASYAVQIGKSSHELSTSTLLQAYEKMNEVFPAFIKELQCKGWHTDRFLDGSGCRFAL
ncbi:hypothetical protein JHK85_036789 [Glycine max]|nr:hypothetical protein JHK85_036789 [Glycine max]